MNLTSLPRGVITLLRSLLITLAVLVLVSWLDFTPAGILGKADAVGYAVCHRIPARSFQVENRPLPLCARCSGMHLGALVGLLFQLPQRKRGGMPPLKIMVVLGLFLAAFAVDGVNSYVQFFPFLPHLYESNNWLRLLTGTGLGIGIAAVLFPVFNQSTWIDWDPRPALGSWKQLGILIVLGLLIDAALLSDISWILYPLALLSSANVVLVLSIIYAVVFMLIFKKENTYHSFKELWVPLVFGLMVSILQIGVMDLLRLQLTGTWDGFFTSEINLLLWRLL